MPTLAALIDAYEHPGRQVGAYCKRGHERAIHERKYARPSGGVVRVCMACQQESRRGGQLVRRWLNDGHPDDLLWQTFCRTIEQRIQAVRARTPRCPECGVSS